MKRQTGNEMNAKNTTQMEHQHIQDLNPYEYIEEAEDEQDDVIIGNEVLVWGCNKHGQLGVGNRLEGIDFPKISLKSVSCGYDHSLLLTESGHIYSMGSNKHGQLGLGTPTVTSKSSPSLIDLLGHKVINFITVGAHHSIAVTRSGQVFTWGRGDSGQLGLGYNKDVSNPQPIQFEISSGEYHRATQITLASAGPEHTMFVTRRGELFGTGSNLDGRLGLGSIHSTDRPVLNSYLEARSVQEVACGTKHSLVLLTEGQLYACGDNSKGQLGVQGYIEHNRATKPVRVTEIRSRKVLKISAGDFSSCITNKGEFLLWGLPCFSRTVAGKKKNVVKYELKSGISDLRVNRMNAIMLDKSGKLWKLNLDDCASDSPFGFGKSDFVLGGSQTGHNKSLQVSSVEGREVKCIGVGKDFTVALCVNDRLAAGSERGESLPITQRVISIERAADNENEGESELRGLEASQKHPELGLDRAGYYGASEESCGVGGEAENSSSFSESYKSQGYHMEVQRPRQPPKHHMRSLDEIGEEDDEDLEEIQRTIEKEYAEDASNPNEDKKSSEDYSYALRAPDSDAEYLHKLHSQQNSGNSSANLKNAPLMGDSGGNDPTASLKRISDLRNSNSFIFQLKSAEALNQFKIDANDDRFSQEIAILIEQGKRHKQALDLLLTENENYQRLNNTLMQENSKLRKKNKILEAAEIKVIAYEKDMEEMAKDFEATYAQMEKNLNSSKEEKIELMKALSEEIEQKKALEERVEQKIRLERRLSQQREDIRKECNEQSEQLVKELRVKLGHAEDAQRLKDNQIEDLEAKIQELAYFGEDFELELKKKEEEIVILRRKLEESSQLYDDLEKSYVKKIGELREAVREKEIRIEIDAQKLEDSQKMVDELKKRCKALTKEQLTPKRPISTKDLSSSHPRSSTKYNTTHTPTKPTSKNNPALNASNNNRQIFEKRQDEYNSNTTNHPHSIQHPQKADSPHAAYPQQHQRQSRTNSISSRQKFRDSMDRVKQIIKESKDIGQVSFTSNKTQKGPSGHRNNHKVGAAAARGRRSSIALDRSLDHHNHRKRYTHKTMGKVLENSPLKARSRPANKYSFASNNVYDTIDSKTQSSALTTLVEMRNTEDSTLPNRHKIPDFRRNGGQQVAPRSYIESSDWGLLNSLDPQETCSHVPKNSLVGGNPVENGLNCSDLGKRRNDAIIEENAFKSTQKIDRTSFGVGGRPERGYGKNLGPTGQGDDFGGRVVVGGRFDGRIGSDIGGVDGGGVGAPGDLSSMDLYQGGGHRGIGDEFSFIRKPPFSRTNTSKNLNTPGGADRHNHLSRTTQESKYRSTSKPRRSHHNSTRNNSKHPKNSLNGSKLAHDISGVETANRAPLAATNHTNELGVATASSIDSAKAYLRSKSRSRSPNYSRKHRGYQTNNSRETSMERQERPSVMHREAPKIQIRGESSKKARKSSKKSKMMSKLPMDDDEVLDGFLINTGVKSTQLTSLQLSKSHTRSKEASDKENRQFGNHPQNEMHEGYKSRKSGSEFYDSCMEVGGQIEATKNRKQILEKRLKEFEQKMRNYNSAFLS